MDPGCFLTPGHLWRSFSCPQQLSCPLPPFCFWNMPLWFPPVASSPPASVGLSQALETHSPWLQEGDGPQGEWDPGQDCCIQEVTVASAPRGGVCRAVRGRGGEERGRGGDSPPAWSQILSVLLEFLSCPASFGHPVSRIPPNSHSFLDSAAMCWPPNPREDLCQPGRASCQQGQAKDNLQPRPPWEEG